MRLLSSIKSIFNTKPVPPPAPPPPPDPEPEIDVPELSIADLRARIAQPEKPTFVLDVREPLEWQQVRIDDAQFALDVLHVPMNSVPDQLDALPADRQVVVMCAHGMRSYGVAHYLIENGLDAINLAGGITAWAQEGGAVEMGK